MKLIRFSSDASAPSFGLVIGAHAVSFASLQAGSGQQHPALANSQSYLAGLPASEQAARSLLAWGEAHLAELSDTQKPLLEAVRLHSPIEVSALFDFGLTPRHLTNSINTMLHYEKDNPQTATLLESLRKMLLAPRAAATPGVPERLAYYKSNLNSVVGDDVEVPWPVYTSRLDIEPELAVVYGNPQQPVAGYCIFNDVSARDVQAPEIIAGFCMTKDMANGNQLGPWLVTADEVGNPFTLAVSVTVDGAPRFKGSTAEISHTVEAMFGWLGLICPLTPGTVMGMGTIPDCTGMDNDDFLDPGAEITISIEHLGTLHCRFAEPTRQLLPSRWTLRPALQKYHD